MSENTENRRSVYFINELKRADDGGYIPCIAVENVKGYYATDWNWGDDLDLAKELCAKKNKAMGYTEIEAFLIWGTTF